VVHCFIFAAVRCYFNSILCYLSLSSPSYVLDAMMAVNDNLVARWHWGGVVVDGERGEVDEAVGIEYGKGARFASFH